MALQAVAPGRGGDFVLFTGLIFKRFIKQERQNCLDGHWRVEPGQLDLHPTSTTPPVLHPRPVSPVLHSTSPTRLPTVHPALQPPALHPAPTWAPSVFPGSKALGSRLDPVSSAALSLRILLIFSETGGLGTPRHLIFLWYSFFSLF
jgi:hypothetical protein